MVDITFVTAVVSVLFLVAMTGMVSYIAFNGPSRELTDLDDDEVSAAD